MMITTETNTQLFTFVFLLKATLCGTEWVDPFNVDFVAEKRAYDTDPFSSNWNSIERLLESACSAPSSDAMLYYKRTINLLLASVVLDEISGNYKGRLVIDIPTENFKVLKEFTSGDAIEPLMLQKINEILTNTLEMTFVDKMELAFMNWTDIWYNLLMNKTTGFMVVVSSVLFVVYRLSNAKFSKKEIACYLGFLCYVFDFCITWKRMLQEVEINQYADNQQYLETPADCFPDKMNGWQIFISYFKATTDCRKYYKAMMYDVVWDVGPLDVIAHQSRVLIQIFTNLGIAISQMVAGLMGNLPFPLNIILLPLMMIFALLIISIIFTYFTNTDLSINFLHLLQFKLKKTSISSLKHREEIQEIISPKTVAEKIESKSPVKQQPIEDINKLEKLDAICDKETGQKSNDKVSCDDSKVVENCDKSANDKNNDPDCTLSN